MLSLLRDDDIFIITADHGCDPGDTSTDHTRELVPLLVLGKGLKSQNIGQVDGFNSVAKTITELFGVDFECDGQSLTSYLR
jgi:phosphopentomutase